MASELEVGGLKVGSPSDPTLKLHNTTGSTNDTAAVVFGVSTGTADGPRIESKRQSDGTIDLNLFTAGATSQTNASAAIVIDGGTNNVGIGTPTPTVGNLQIRDASVSTFALTRTTGNTGASLGIIRFGNTDVDSNLANIVGYQDGATDSAAIAFQTQPTGGVTTTRLTIDSTGLATFTGGINLGDTNLSNYKEGTWTPVLAISGGNDGGTLTQTAGALGKYVRIGKMVHVMGIINVTAASGLSGATTIVQVNGFPFTADVNATYNYQYRFNFSREDALTSRKPDNFISFYSASTTGFVYDSGLGTGITGNELTTGKLVFSGSYITT